MYIYPLVRELDKELTSNIFYFMHVAIKYSNLKGVRKELNHHTVDAKLYFTDSSSQNCTDFETSQLTVHHEQPWQSKPHKLPPLSQLQPPEVRQ